MRLTERTAMVAQQATTEMIGQQVRKQCRPSASMSALPQARGAPVRSASNKPVPNLVPREVCVAGRR